MVAEWSRIVGALREACAGVGLDIVHPFAVGTYNRALPAELELEDFGRETTLGVLFANTRALWTPFLEALKSDVALADDAHPLERYLETRLVPLLPRPHRLYWAQELEPRPLPIQRLAELVGLAPLSPSHLSIHPEHGPWLALRAVAVFDEEGPGAPVPLLDSPCSRCSRPCLPALETALAQTGNTPDAGAIARQADAWIAVRDACPVGKAARYGEHQLRYHYTKDRKFLR